LLWTGMFVLSTSGFDRAGQWLAAASPLFVAFLLIKVSGVPLLEKAAAKKWAEDADYRRYRDSVPVLIPFIGRTGDAEF
jgi:steroid 5-alpha reductase family enzyme